MNVVLRPDLLPGGQKLKLERVEIDDLRFYRTPAGVFPSATTVLSATKRASDRIALAKWREAVGEEEADAHTSRRCEEGDRFHAEIEEILSNPFADVSALPEGSPFLDSVRGIVAKIEEVVAVELPVYSSRGFAGTLDLLAYIQGIGLVLLDWKTTLRRKGEGRLRDYVIQLAAYEEALSSTFGLKPDAALIVLAQPDVPAALRLVDRTELNIARGEFFARLEEFNQQRRRK